MEALRNAVRTLTSKSVQRAAVNAILLASGIGTLLGLAAISSVLFFHAYLPHRVLTSPVYLQYGSSPNPYGITMLEASRMKSLQDYDVSVTFTIPRSPANLDRGNFMVSLDFLDSRESNSIVARADEHARSHAGFGASNVLLSSRRPALIPYIDPLVSKTSRVLFMAYHLLSSNSQHHTLTVRLAERVSFGSGSTRPAAAYIEVEAGQDIQIYSTQLTLTARLSGLRWLMVHYRILSYIVLTLLFWFFEVLFMSAAWSVWTFSTSMPADKGKRAIKGFADAEASNSGDDIDADNDDEDSDEVSGEEDDDDADVGGEAFRSRRQHPDRSAYLKREPGVKDEATPERALADIPMAGADADDEADSDGGQGKLQYVSGRGMGFIKAEASNMRRRASPGGT